MKKLNRCLGLLMFLTLITPLRALAQVQVGVAVGAGGDSFHLAIGSYFHAPPEQVAVVEQRHIPEEESPVVFFIAARAHVAPGVILDLRAGGMGWGAIAERYRLGPQVFYVPANGNFAGTPYEGFYRGYRRPGYRMRDAEIVNMVNLRFATDYYHKPAAEVIRLRAGGRNFRAIHEQYHPYARGVRPLGHRPVPVRHEVKVHREEVHPRDGGRNDGDHYKDGDRHHDRDGHDDRDRP